MPAVPQRDPAAVSLFCRQPAPAAFLEGVQAFNDGAYWECHAILEPLWLEEPRPVRDVFKGLIQVAGGYYHINRGNRNGALSLLSKGPEFLQPFGRGCFGLDIAGVMAQADAAREFVLSHSEGAALPSLPPALWPRWHWLDGDHASAAQ